MTASRNQSHGRGRPHRQLRTTLPRSDGPGPAGIIDAGQLPGTKSVEGCRPAHGRPLPAELRIADSWSSRGSFGCRLLLTGLDHALELVQYNPRDNAKWHFGLAD